MYIYKELNLFNFKLSFPQSVQAADKSVWYTMVIKKKKKDILLFKYNVNIEKAEGRTRITHKDENIWEISLFSYMFFII